MGAIQIAIFEGVKIAILNSPENTFDVNSLSAEALLGALGTSHAAFEKRGKK